MREALRHRLHKLQDSTTLAQQLSLLMGVVCLIGLGAVALASARLSEREVSARIQQQMAHTAHTLADRLDTDMFERYREIKILSGMRPLEQVWEGDPALLRSVLNQLQTSMKHFAWIGFALPDGTVRAATQGMLEGSSVSDRPWFKDGRNGAAVGDVHEAVMLGKLLQAAPSNEPDRFVDISFPVRDGKGELIGVLGAHLTFRWAEGLRQTALQGTAGTEVSVLSQDGKVLLGPDIGTTPFPPARIAAMSHAVSGAFVDEENGHRMLTGFAVADGEEDYPGLGWIVIARQHSRVAFASANRLALTIIAVGGIVTLISVALSAWLATRISRPLAALTRAADEIGRNPRVTMLPRLRGSLEVMHLTGALRALLRRLGSQEQRFVQFSQKHEEDVAALRELADTDPLTGLMNRRSFLAVADVALESARSLGGIGILMADIDHFKQVNDTYGHAAGDAVIRHVATIFGAALRAHDRVARFGGEEFVALLQDTDETAMMALADRIRSTIGSTQVPFEGRDITVTVSLGAALAQDRDRDVDEIIERADLGLYEAKNSGRNRVALARRSDTRAA